MNNTLLQIIPSTVKAITASPKQSIAGNYFFWIAIAELIVILFLLTRLNKTKTAFFEKSTEELLKKSKNANIDMENLMNSINGAGELYKELSTKCHPDRFTDIELNKKAGEIFQEITKNKRNYKRLSEIKELAESQLNITF